MNGKPLANGKIEFHYITDKPVKFNGIFTVNLDENGKVKPEDWKKLNEQILNDLEKRST